MGLKVNFNKCCLVGVNMDRDTIENMAATLQCEIGSLPFSYLGIRVGMSYKKRAGEHLIHKVKVKLKKWEHKKLSLGGRITILKAVLAALLIYHLSFYLLCKSSLSNITRIQRIFPGDEE